MAKKSGTRPPPRKGQPSKTLKRSVAKPSAKKPAAKAATPSKKPSVATKSVPAAKRSVPTPKLAAKPIAKPVARANSKATKPILAAAKPAKPVSRTDKTVPVGKGDTSAKVSATARPAKLATPSDRPAPKSANGTPAVLAPAHSSAPIEKPVGRIMLTQGPVAARPLTKKGTFAPVKPGQTSTLKPLPKPVKKRDEVPEQPFIPARAHVPAIRTSEKAQKNKAGLSQKELDFFRDLLLAKRRELVGDMSSMEREALRETGSDLSNLPVHMADQGTDAYEQEFTLHLVEKDRGLLRELNDALAKIHNGSYGLCEGTGLPISKPRLEAQPWARHSIEYARQLEKRQMPFRR